MAPKRIVEALQFELAFEEVEEPPVDLAPPAVSPVTQPLDQRTRGLEAARKALAEGTGGESGDEAVREPPGEPSWPGESSDAALSVTDFYERLRRSLRAGFPDEVWVTGEIRKVSVSKGHRYIELAEHGDATDASQLGQRGSAATLEVACWAREWPAVAARLEGVGLELTAGMVVRVRGRVSVWEAGARIRFSMSELDVEALVGGIAAARRKLLAALEKEGLLEANRLLPTPLVPLRVGLVTSPGSEAYRDFTGQLQRSGFDFKVTLEPSLVQGPEAPFQLQRALERLQSLELDVIVLVRGGGAKGDLAAFDHEAVARAIVTSRYPVWTGIGHTGDRSVADEIAQWSLVTPTACGEAVVNGVASFLELLDNRRTQLVRAGSRALDSSEHQAVSTRSDLVRAARHELARTEAALFSARARAERGAVLALSACGGSLARRSAKVADLAANKLSTVDHYLEHQRALLRGFDPRRQLERGWTLTRSSSGRILRSVEEVAEGETITSVLADGEICSQVRTSTRKGD
jgi:exodeoxyribonuclease VII large subunit